MTWPPLAIPGRTRPAFAGIGSRSTPPAVQQQMYTIARQLAGLNWTLRSGGASGADSAFEQGYYDCGAWAEQAEIFLPWLRFNNNPSLFYQPSDAAYDLAAKVHPHWWRLRPGLRALMARNSYQVLGRDLTDSIPAQRSRFVLCWTPDGCQASRERTRLTGGTGQAIAIADYYNIPVLNMARGEADWRPRLLAIIQRQIGIDFPDSQAQAQIKLSLANFSL